MFVVDLCVCVQVFWFRVIFNFLIVSVCKGRFDNRPENTRRPIKTVALLLFLRGWLMFFYFHLLARVWYGSRFVCVPQKNQEHPWTDVWVKQCHKPSSSHDHVYRWYKPFPVLGDWTSSSFILLPEARKLVENKWLN